MKKALIIALAAMLVSAPVAMAQSKVNIDKSGLVKKAEKSDADAANPKKADKSATWLTRGKLYYDIATAVSSNIFEGTPEATANVMFGQPSRAEVTKGNKDYTMLTYPYFVAYTDAEGFIRAWEVTEEIVPGAMAKAAEAYNTAYNLDQSSKTAPKVKEGLKAIYDEYYKTGSIYFILADYGKAGEFFEEAYKVSQHPGFQNAESEESLANLANDTGIAYLFAPEYAKSLQFLKIAEREGSYREGDVYYLMYHAYRSLAVDNDPAILNEAKEMLMVGLSRFPNNTNIIECLTDVYVALGDNPNDLVPVVEQAIANDPGNSALWNGLGRVYEKLGDTDKAIESFEHVSMLEPTSANAAYSVGILYVRKGDTMSEEVNGDSSISTQSQYDAAMAKVNEVYRASVTPLEKAYDLAAASWSANPADENAKQIVEISAELLKTITFRLREEPGMSEKNQKYVEALKQFAE